MIRKMMQILSFSVALASLLSSCSPSEKDLRVFKGLQLGMSESEYNRAIDILTDSNEIFYRRENQNSFRYHAFEISHKNYLRVQLFPMFRNGYLNSFSLVLGDFRDDFPYNTVATNGRDNFLPWSTEEQLGQLAKLFESKYGKPDVSEEVKQAKIWHRDYMDITAELGDSVLWKNVPEGLYNRTEITYRFNDKGEKYFEQKREDSEKGKIEKDI